MLVPRLILRLALTIMVSGAIPATSGYAFDARALAGLGLSARRSTPHGVAAAVPLRVGRDTTRDVHLRGKQLAAALPLSTPLPGGFTGTAADMRGPDAVRPVDQRTAASPRAPPFQI